jgi:cytochrome c oxidase subunit III
MSDSSLSGRNIPRISGLPVAPSNDRASGWYGMLTVIATEGALFSYLLFTYFYLASQSVNPWPPHGKLRLIVAAPNTAVLLASSVAAWWGQRGIERTDQRQLRIGLAVALVLGAVFVGLQGLEWSNKPFTLSSDAYGSLYFTVTGFHIAHVVVGLVILALLLVWSFLGYFTRECHLRVTIGIVYWHFVDAVWLCVFSTFYLTPYLASP